MMYATAVLIIFITVCFTSCVALYTRALWLHVLIPAAARAALRYTDSRDPDFALKYVSTQDTYLLRWHLIPRNRYMNIYLHRMLNSDEGKELHDHPYANISIILAGGFYEQIHGKAHWRKPGQIVGRLAATPHRLTAQQRTAGPTPSMSIFITGPRTRQWGFITADGWVPFYKHNALRANNTTDTDAGQQY